MNSLHHENLDNPMESESTKHRQQQKKHRIINVWMNNEDESHEEGYVSESATNEEDKWSAECVMVEDEDADRHAEDDNEESRTHAEESDAEEDTVVQLLSGRALLSGKGEMSGSPPNKGRHGHSERERIVAFNKIRRIVRAERLRQHSDSLSRNPFVSGDSCEGRRVSFEPTTCRFASDVKGVLEGNIHLVPNGRTHISAPPAFRESLTDGYESDTEGGEMEGLPWAHISRRYNVDAHRLPMHCESLPSEVPEEFAPLSLSPRER